MRILLLEPDRILARTYSAAFADHGHITDVCSTAQSAIASADTVRPDIVILELQLVLHSGIEFLYEFRSYVDWISVPIVILTCVPAIEFISSWKTLREILGVERYLYKPQTDLNRLLSILNEITADIS